MADGIGSELMALFTRGSPKAFQAIWQEFYTRLVYFCEQYTSDIEQAKEIASDALTKCLMKQGDFKSYPALRSFLYTTARNGAIDHFRSKKRLLHKQEEYFASLGQDDLINHQVEGELMKDLSISIEKLPPRSKEVIKLLYLRQLSYQQIADLMKISINTVISIRRYALTMMREDLRNKEFELLVTIFFILFILF
jgi:RNA polymerase sigma-70 factor (ECF subfamily)